ncbi:outer membrane protein assembly factor BamB family protein, partial [Streptomyces otsuchiensis]
RGVAPEALWRYDAPGESLVVPRVWRDGTVLLSSSDRMTGVDLATGEEVWTRGDVGVSPSLLGDVAPFPLEGSAMAFAHHGEIVAIDAETGAQLWTDTRYVPQDAEYGGRRLDRVYLSTDDGTALLLWTRSADDDYEGYGVALYDTVAREERWHVPVPMDGSDALFSIIGDSVHVVSGVDGGYRQASYRIRDGDEEWVRDLDGELTFNWLSALDSEGLFVSGSEGDIQLHDAVTLEPLWDRAVGTSQSRFGNARAETVRWEGEGRKVLFLNDDDVRVIALDLATGEELWRGVLRDESAYEGIVHPRTALTPSGSTLLVGGMEVTALDARTGAVRWVFQHAERADRATYSVFAGRDAMLVWDGTTAFGLPVE